MYLVSFVIRVFHDARSSECRNMYILHMCCAFVGLDNKLYKMHGTCIAIANNYICSNWQEILSPCDFAKLSTAGNLISCRLKHMALKVVLVGAPKIGNFWAAAVICELDKPSRSIKEPCCGTPTIRGYLINLNLLCIFCPISLHIRCNVTVLLLELHI